MTSNTLYQELNYVNHSREKRLHYANLLLADTSLIPKVLDILFMVDDKISPRAAWILEFMCGENLEAIIPHLDQFTEHMNKVHLDSAERPVAKICEYLAKAYYGKEPSKLKQALLPKHHEKIVELCFDYMINDVKVAPKAYGMNTLYLFGKDYDWIYPELILILERDFHTQSAAFKARARHILKKIKKK
ncbi:adenylosuccinate lyase [Olleya sp. YS]|uniref:adenylosuccinate lyase n=1 Tax=Olleya sp. YS TaxID=3028318 RepID=UPI002434332B|nr:adenylosuccinate lyase [Olleya sp. YS]WGD34932.1 adenylosuccinate lyase [Olleya sp. YS]